MAKLRKEDIFDPSFKQGIDEAIKAFRELGKEARAFSQAIKESKGFAEYERNAKKATEATKRFAKSEEKLVKTIQATRFENTEAAKQLAIANERKRRAVKANRDYAKSQLAAVKSTNRWGTALRSFQFKFNALGNLIAQAAATIFRSFIRAVKQSIDVVKNFDKSTARLASVVGKTRKEIADLTKQAKELGSVTQFTATQVTGLQIELAKLGFTADEIQAATPGILSFATATGANLAEAAKTAGAAVRVFGLNASETTDAVATLAVATTKSGLTFEAFDTILSTVGPVAKAYGFTLEDVVALTGELATAGFEANKAATATRNILLNLADANGALAKSLGGSVDTFDDLIDGLIALDAKGIDLGTTLELTDKRSVAAFSRFLEGAESARQLRDGISDVNDELQQMVDVQLDTLAGDIDLLKSAWEGFILSLSSDGGLLRQAVQLLTNAVLQAQNLDLAVRKFHKQNSEEITRSIDLLESLTNKQGTEFSNLTAALADETAVQLEEQRSAIIFHLSEIRKINKKEAAAIFNELVRQRKEQEDAEFKAAIEKADRLRELAEKGNAEVTEVVKESISTLKEELKKQKEALETATLAEAASINVVILGLEKRIKTYQNVGKAFILMQELISKIKPEDEFDFIEDLDNLFDADIAEEIRVASQELTKDLIANSRERWKTEEELAREHLEAIREIEQEKRDLTVDIGNEGFNFLLSLNDRKIALLDEQLEKGVGNEKKLQEEKAKLQRRAAIFEKAQALFNIGIKTAEAVVNYGSKVITAPLIPFVISLGLAQAAVVLASPIPKFEKGIKSTAKGPAIVSEKGPELFIDKQGHIGLTPEKESMMYFDQGTQVIPADITSQLLRYTNVMQGAGTSKDSVIEAILESMELSNEKLRREIRNKPVASSTQTAAGILTSIHKGNTTIKRLDKYFK